MTLLIDFHVIVIVLLYSVINPSVGGGLYNVVVSLCVCLSVSGDSALFINSHLFPKGSDY